MTKIKIDSDGELYMENFDRVLEDTPLGYYPRILDAAYALVDLRKKFDEAQADDQNSFTKYHDTIYPFAIILEIDGEPVGTVRYVDDFVSWIPFEFVSCEEDKNEQS